MCWVKSRRALTAWGRVHVEVWNSWQENHGQINTEQRILSPLYGFYLWGPLPQKMNLQCLESNPRMQWSASSTFQCISQFLREVLDCWPTNMLGGLESQASYRLFWECLDCRSVCLYLLGRFGLGFGNWLCLYIPGACRLLSLSGKPDSSGGDPAGTWCEGPDLGDLGAGVLQLFIAVRTVRVAAMKLSVNGQLVNLCHFGITLVF